MSAKKSSVRLASCRYHTPFAEETAFRARAFLPRVQYVKLYRRPFSSARATSNASISTGWQRNILITLPTLFLLDFTYQQFNPDFRRPLALDTSDASEKVEHDAKQFKPLFRAPTIEEADEALRWEELSKCHGPPTDILRYDSVRVPSNSPCEDVLLTAMASDADDPNAVDQNVQWAMWGVYDGHEGWETAATLHDYLVSYIVAECLKLLPDHICTPALSFSSTLPPASIDQAIKNAFLRLDAEMMQTGAAAALGPRFLGQAFGELRPGFAGSCALLCIYDCANKLLRTACVGDSRAVLGRRNVKGEYEAIPLSVDQTGYNEAEAARIRAEHPNEPDVIQKGRVLGMAVTRAFGDGRWKWPMEVQEKAYERFFGPKPRDGCLTPPYLTAEPVITTTEIDAKNRDFVILASDGLWDQITSEQAVELVGRWLMTHDPEKPPPPQPSMGLLTQLPERDVLKEGEPEEGRVYVNRRLAKKENFVVVDENAATHLARNALGGGDEDVLRGAMMAQAPFSRDLRDDITIQVIFFGHGGPKTTAEIQNW